MAADKEKGQRRVYVLPNELVERIVAFQKEMGFQSEVEAARRLLDAALKSRDDWLRIVRRFQERLREGPDMLEIAKDVLVGHPLVKSITYLGEDRISFKLKDDDDEVTVFQDGTAQKGTGYGNQNVKFVSKDGEVLDDEIPF